MAAIRRRTQRALFIVIASLLGVSLFAPIVALGNEDLGSGDTAIISTGGGDATLRAEASFSASSVGSIPNGTEVFIVDGPISDADGSIWYMAGIWDITGFINATVLDGGDAESAEDQAPAEDAPPTEIPWQQPIEIGVVVDNANTPLPADGLACRVDAVGAADVIVRFDRGQAVEVVGQEVWSEGIAFLPVNCAGQGGYVKADYVALNSAAAPEPVAAEPAAPVVDDLTEDVVAEEAVPEDEPADDVAPDLPAVAAPVVGDLIVTISDERGDPVPGACFDLYAASGWVAHACDSTDAIPNNGNSGFFGIPEGSYTVIAASAPAGVAIPNLEVSVAAGDTSYTGSTVTTAVVAEPVAAEDTTEEVAAEEATDEVVAEEATDEVAAEEATDEVAAEEATDEVAAEDVTEEVAAEEATEEIAADEATDEVTAEEPATGPDLSQAIGDATVTGANGEGVRCHVAPDPTSATITVLAEGATVFVLEAPTNGFLGVACANQLGYADITFMWSGGAGDEIPSSASSVVVVGTGDMMLNCRNGGGAQFGVITAVAPGSVLTARGASANGWAPVVCGGMNGFVSIMFVEVTGGTAAPDPGVTAPPEASGTGTVANTEGAGLRCRTSAPSGSTITVLPEGTRVTTRGAASDGWFPVVCAGMNGFVSAQFFTVGASTPNPGSDAGSDDNEGGAASGFVRVSNTGGASLNCRSAASMSGMVITAIPAGSQVALRGAASNGWQPVTCANRNGYVSSSFVTASNDSSSPPPAASGTGAVANTGGAGLRCRTSTPSGSTITVLPEGTRVTTRGAAANGWVPVVCSGMNGFVAAQFFTMGASTPGSGNEEDPDPGNGGGAATGFVRVSNTGGASLNCRSAAGLSGMVITSIRADSVVEVRGGAVNGWQPVTCANRSGYVSANFVATTTDSGNPDPEEPDEEEPGSARVVNTGGEGLRCRTAPNGSIITVVTEGASVGTRGAAINGWTPVICGGRDGFMSSEFLATGGGATTPAPSPTPDPGSGAGMGNGDHGRVSARANMRYQASMGASVMIVVERGEVLLITGAVTNGFYPVNYDGLRAFMSADVLTETSEALSKRGGSGSGVSVGTGAVFGDLTPRISQPFGQTSFSTGAGSWMYGYAGGLGISGGHPGIDYLMPRGTRVYVPVSGTVVYAGGTGWFRDSLGDGAGRGELRIRTDNGHEIIFGHMSWIPLLKGQRVVAGELAGLSGTFNGDHLHLEVRVPGNTSSGWQAVDPATYFGG